MNRELVTDTLEALEQVADMLYKGHTGEGISAFGEHIQGICAICEGIEDGIVRSRLLTEVLTPIMHAMEKKDGIELADLIHYELRGALEDLL